MNSQELKLAIADDIKTIKALDPDIIPARTYYLSLLKLMLNGFWKVWLITSITIAFSGLAHPSHEGLARQATSQVIFESTLMAFFLSIGAMLLLCPSLNFFIQFQFHLKNKIKTGELIESKLNHMATVFFVFFILFSALFGSYGESAAIFIMVVFAFFGSLLATYFFVRMELNRIGVSTILAVISEFFKISKAVEISLE